MIATFLDGATQAQHTLLNAAISAGKNVGLYKQPTLQIVGSTLEVGASSGLFGCGVFYSEDSTTPIAITGLGQDTVYKTVVYELDPQLYAQPQLVVVDGLKPIGYDAYHLVVAWLYYPGGNLTLSDGMIVEAPLADVSRVMQFFGGGSVNQKLATALGSSADASLSFSEGWSTLASTSSVSKTWRIEFELQSDSSPVSCLDFDVQLSSQAYLRLYFKRYGSNEVLVVDGTLNGKLDQGTWQIPLARHRVRAWERFSIYADLALGVGSFAKFGSFMSSNKNIISPAAR